MQRSTRKNGTHEPIRLNRYLAQLGIGSRRACDELITSGKIFVDGKKVDTPGMKILPGKSRVRMGRIYLDSPPHRVILLLNKPEGVVTTVSDPLERTTVIDLCRRQRFTMRLFPVGRLDINTTGAILLTNDGLLCYRLTHPRFQVPKTYMVRARGLLTDRKLRRLRSAAAPPKSGTGRRQPLVAPVKILKKESIIRIVLYEGQNRQVRKMCEASGLRIVKLKRVQFGPISIRRLPEGTLRQLTRKEIEMLEAAISGGA